MPILALLTFTFAALIAGLIAGAVLNRTAIGRRVDAEVARLFEQIDTLPTYYTEADIADEPEPVRRYFARNLNEGMPHQSCVRVRESGNTRQEPGQPWTEFVAQEYMVSHRPGMLWFARMRPYPLIWVDLICSYVGGLARVQSKLLSTLSSVDASDEATRRATLLRYVAGLPLFPGALLPADDRGWSEHEADSARFRLRDGELEVAGVFFFDELGNVVRFETEERPYEGRHQPANARWIVRYGEHRAFGSGADLQLPTQIDIEWELGDQTFHYLDMKVEEFELDVPHAWSAVVAGATKAADASS